MKKYKKIFWAICLLLGGFSFVGVGVLSLYTGFIIVPELGASVFRTEQPIIWLIQTITTLIGGVFWFYLFYHFLKKKD